MARPFEQVAPDRLQIQEGGGCIGAFGLPFFAAGVFMLLIVAGVVPVTNAAEMSSAGWLVLLFMGVVFSAGGGTLAFGRSWTTLDVTQHLVVKQWGLLIPMKEQTPPLRGYTAVTLGYIQGDADTADRFPVGLKAQVGADLPLCSYTGYATSRDCAVAVARHLQLDIEDATTDHRVRVSPGEADRPFRNRRFDVGSETALPRRTERLLTWLTRLTKGRGLTVKTRTELTTFGAGLEDDEIRDLHSIVRRALHG